MAEVKAPTPGKGRKLRAGPGARAEGEAKRLRESEERYRSLFRDSPISLWDEDFSEVKRYVDGLRAGGVTDVRGHLDGHPEEIERCAGLVRVNEVNQATLDLYRVRSPEDFLKGLGAFFTEDSYAVFRDEIVAVAEGRIRFEGEISTRTVDGEERRVFITWTVPPAHAATYAKVIVSIVDITDLERAREALRRERSLLDRLTETSPAGITQLDREGRIVFANRKAEEVLGLSRDEISRRHYNAPNWRITTYSGEPFPDAELPFVKVRETLRPVADVRHAVERPDGRRILLRVNASPLLDGSGGFEGVVATVEDVTAQVQADERLRASEEKYRLITDSMSDGLFILDDSGCFLFLSPRWLALAGYSEADLLGRPFTEVLPPEHVGVAVRNFGRALRGERIPLYEIEVLRKDGSRFPIELNMSNYLDAGGRVAGRLGVFRDITERREAEASLQAALREKDVLLREVHHRVKNNLQVVSSLLNLQAGALKDPAAREMFRESQRRIRSMALIHEKLYQSADFAGVPFADYIRTLIVHLTHSFQVDPGRIAVTTDLEDVRLEMSVAVPCGLIVNELFSNALKHAFPGGRKGEVRVRLRGRDGGPHELAVADDGVGLPEGFDVHAAKSMGMQIVSMLVGQIDGSLETGPGPGASFTVRFGSPRKARPPAP